MAVHLVTEPRGAPAVISFKATERKRTPIGEDHSPPNSLQSTLTVPNVRIIYSYERGLPAGSRMYLPVAVSYTFSRTKAANQPWQIGVELLFEHRRESASQP